jgi:hypothetical protein
MTTENKAPRVNKLTHVAVTTLITCGMAASAHAALLEGSLSISSLPVPPNTAGPVIAVDAAGNELPSFAGATGLDFTSTGELTPGTAGDIQVDAASGDFAAFDQAFGTIEDFSFAGAGSADYPLPPIDGFELIVGGLEFDLETIQVDFQTANTLLLSGTGIFQLAGFDDTEGTFVFSGNDQGATFSFSVSQTTIPEPAPLALIGLGIVAFGLRRNRQA